MSTQSIILGAGTTPAEKLPARSSSTTEAKLGHEFAKRREQIRRVLQPLLDTNEAFTGFCTDPEAVLRFTVDPAHHSTLFTRQSPLADVWTDSINEILER